MKVNISYKESLTFDEFKEKFDQYFLLSNLEKKETEMKKAWEKAEEKIRSIPASEDPASGGKTIGIDYDDDEDSNTEKGDNKTFAPD